MRILEVRKNGVTVKDFREKPGRVPPAPIPKLPPPTLGELMGNFAGALGRFVKAGFKTVDEPTFQKRIAVCRACEYWQEDARAGLGKCEHPGCGCTRFKHWMATEKCPLSKW